MTPEGNVWTGNLGSRVEYFAESSPLFSLTASIVFDLPGIDYAFRREIPRVVDKDDILET